MKDVFSRTDPIHAAGGVITTLKETDKQWDAPNDWAPLQWLTIKGLRNYAQDDLAKDIAECWIKLNVRVFRETGKLMEKYDVQDAGAELVSNSHDVSYQPSMRKWKGTPEQISYRGMATRRVKKAGAICYEDQRVFISQALADGTWACVIAVSSC